MPYERLRIAYMSKLDFSIVRTVHWHTQCLTLLLYVRYKYSILSLTHVTILPQVPVCSVALSSSPKSQILIHHFSPMMVQWWHDFTFLVSPEFISEPKGDVCWWDRHDSKAWDDFPGTVLTAHFMRYCKQLTNSPVFGINTSNGHDELTRLPALTTRDIY